MPLTYHVPSFNYHRGEILRSSLSKIRIRHLTLLSLLVEFGSIRQAAARLHITQPAVSRMVIDLEQAFGGPLFERSAQGMTPNTRALALLRRSQVMLKELATAESELDTPLPQPKIRIGAVSHVVLGLLPQAISLLESSSPCLHISIRTASIIPLLGSLRDGDLDCVVGRLSSKHFPAADMPVSDGFAADLDYQVLYDEPLCVVATKQHPLSKRHQVHWKDLVKERWLLPTPGGLVYRLIENEFLNAGYSIPAAVIECDQYAFSLPIVAKTKLITVVPINEARKYSGSVKILPIQTQIAAPPLVFAFRRSSSDMTSLNAVRHAIIEAAGASLQPNE